LFLLELLDRCTPLEKLFLLELLDRCTPLELSARDIVAAANA
jgi:hypothetical protein